MRILTLALLLALLAAGCIAPSPNDAKQNTSASTPPVDRISGMSADISKTDKAVTCNQGGGITPQSCAERTLKVTGRIGVDKLPVELVSINGPITVRQSDGDAWSFDAVVRVSAATQDMANSGLDTAWTWTHVEGSQHMLKAGPTSASVANMTPLPLGSPGSAQVVSTRYAITLPAWVTLTTANLKGDNGDIILDGFHTEGLQMTSVNGGLQADGWGTDVKLSTTNGGIMASMLPTASGHYDLSTVNGAMTVALAEDATHALDADAKTQNGAIVLEFTHGKLTTDERNHKHYKADGFDAATVKTTLTMQTNNGAIEASG